MVEAVSGGYCKQKSGSGGREIGQFSLEVGHVNKRGIVGNSGPFSDLSLGA